MKSKQRAGIVLIVIFTMMVNFTVNAFDNDMTRHIRDTEHDLFVLDTGVGIDANFMTVLSPDMDIRGMLFFEDMKINRWEVLKNATLRLRTFHGRSFEADSSITIYGVRDYGGFGYSEARRGSPGSPAAILSLPLTSAFVNYNTSQFYGTSWKEIDVTSLVNEMKSDRNYDGPGLVGSDRGDDMIFMIFGVEGFEPRSFYDFRAGNNLEAQLVLHWTDSPPPPPDSPPAYFNESYRNYTIWVETDRFTYPDLGPVDYIFVEGLGAPYDFMYDTTAGPGPISAHSDTNDDITKEPGQQKLIRLENGTLYTVYPKGAGNSQINIKKSNDDGATWIDETLISTRAGMNGNPQITPSIAFNSTNAIFVTWAGKATGFATDDQIWVVNYTDSASWGEPVRVSTGAGMNGEPQLDPTIALGKKDKIHIVWAGWEGGDPTRNVWYVGHNTSWGTPVRISTYAGMVNLLQSDPVITVDSRNYIHVVWSGKATGFPSAQIWYRNKTTAWDTNTRISTYAGQSGSAQTFPVIAMDQDDRLYTVWTGTANGFGVSQIWIANYTFTDSWSTPVRISTLAGMDVNAQYSPSISIEDSQVFSIWWGKATGYLDAYKIWYATYTNVWSAPFPLQPVGNNIIPNLRWSRWPSEPLNDTYFVVDPNGTILVTDLEDYEDALIYIDDILGVDPDEPEPAGQDWAPSGPFTRFKTRLYIFLMGVGMLWGPLFVFSMKRPTGYAFVIGLFIMLIGLGFLIHAGTV